MPPSDDKKLLSAPLSLTIGTLPQSRNRLSHEKSQKWLLTF